MKRIAVFAAALLAACAAHAIEYTGVQANRSAVGFKYKQMGVAMNGRFRSVAGELRFDPANPAAANARIEIDLAGVDTGSTEADQEVAGKQWFDAAAFPVARFVATKVKALENDRFGVAGALSIKGHTQEVIALVDYAAEGSNGMFDGHLSIQRSDFGIGAGAWSDFDIVANEVRIEFHIVASADTSGG